MSATTDYIDQTKAEIERESIVDRIWQKDSTLWATGAHHQKLIANSLGWLTVADTLRQRTGQLLEFAGRVRAKFDHVVLLGMGGSSLCPEVLRRTFGAIPGYPQLLVLDSTVPAAIRAVEDTINLARTLLIVSSKSGTTIEPLTLFEYFFERVSRAGAQPPGKQFVAITDPGTPLELEARSRDFLRVFLNPPDIGGRYSALSLFGIVPAVLAGYDVNALLASAARAAQLCKSSSENPGALLGAYLAMACQGRDKLTLVTPEPLDGLGLWIEQLVAESTGKNGRGIVPVAGEPLADSAAYGEDRLFVLIGTRDSISEDVEARLAEVERAGHPVIKRSLASRLDLGSEFFVWEFATAVAGALLGINPFDQPNVQESKDNTGRLLEAFEQAGRLREPAAITEGEGVRVFTANGVLSPAEGLARPLTAGRVVAEHLLSIEAGDYVALLAYIEETPEHNRLLEAIRAQIRDRFRVATSVGYGPRYLHSTGQLHKGGPANGLFIEITADDRPDIAIPGRPYSFGTLKAAQALGDFEALAGRGRRVIRFHVGADIPGGLAKLSAAVREN